MKLFRVVAAILILFLTWYLLLFVGACVFVIDLVEEFRLQRTETYVEVIVDAFESVAGLNGRHRN